MPAPARADRSSATTSKAFRVAAPGPIGTTEEGSATGRTVAPSAAVKSLVVRVVARSCVRAVTAITSNGMRISKYSHRRVTAARSKGPRESVHVATQIDQLRGSLAFARAADVLALHTKLAIFDIYVTNTTRETASYPNLNSGTGHTRIPTGS